MPLTFLYHDRWRDHGITLMRGKQLSRMIAERFPDRYDVTYTPDIEAVRDQVVIVNRGALQGYDEGELASLRARNPLLISDWLDLPVVPAKHRLFDAHLAMSPLQSARHEPALSGDAVPSTSRTTSTRTCRTATPPTDRLRTGYFGLLDNTVLPGTLTGAVELVSAVDSSFTAQHWQEAAPRFNCHWIVRRISPYEWHKPFLKGFVAARCGAAVIVTRDDMNAAFYLGDDYPYYAASADPADLELAWLRAASGFGGPEWAMAQAIMKQVAARCTEEQVVTEFRFHAGRTAALMDVECVVVGAGVVGLAVARALAVAGREVVVLEAEGQIGSHTSSRNSEVIHAGIYYPKGSAKARLCVRGKELLYAYCASRGVPHRRIGKMIVATEAGAAAGARRGRGGGARQRRRGSRAARRGRPRAARAGAARRRGADVALDRDHRQPRADAEPTRARPRTTARCVALRRPAGRARPRCAGGGFEIEAESGGETACGSRPGCSSTPPGSSRARSRRRIEGLAAPFARARSTTARAPISPPRAGCPSPG